jgi:cytoplasmic iron level regulating protein YaaA (DUF328/UPF0246 family)
MMFVLISPAKKLLAFSKPYLGETTQPLFSEYTKVLAQIMKQKSVQDLAQMMDLSQPLAVLNYQRYQEFSFDQNNHAASYPALLLFQGDVYQGLQAKGWSQEEVKYAQSHLGILSGLYGLLRPLDSIQAYRLEMGVRLANPEGNTLYDFWRAQVTDYLNDLLQKENDQVLINLASTEYFKVIDVKRLHVPLVTIQFYEHKNGETKIIGIYAKKARGLMAKFIIQNRVSTLEQLKQFHEQGYRFMAQNSSSQELVFIREH